MSQVVLKDNWSITCNDAAQYEGIKTLLQMLGYSFEQYDYYSSDYDTVCVSDWREAGVTQGFTSHPEDHHFDNVLDFLVFHYDAQEEADSAIADLRVRLAAIDELLAAA